MYVATVVSSGLVWFPDWSGYETSGSYMVGTMQWLKTHINCKDNL